jgi:spire-like protein
MSFYFQAAVQIGLVIYTALDYGLREDEERQLSPQMEKLLDLMTSAGGLFYENQG